MLIDADGVIEFPLRVVRRGDLIIEWFVALDGKTRVIVRRHGEPLSENAQLRALTRRVQAT